MGIYEKYGDPYSSDPKLVEMGWQFTHASGGDREALNEFYKQAFGFMREKVEELEEGKDEDTELLKEAQDGLEKYKEELDAAYVYIENLERQLKEAKKKK